MQRLYIKEHLRGLCALDLLDDIHTLNDHTKDDMTTIEPGGLDGGDKELGSVGVLSRIGHGKHAGASMLQLKVLILKSIRCRYKQT